ncbi:Inosine/uridine-preferring nucleoside hydrolase domain-containing protein [Pavlovales sp. CCMP2436]|nr:Inosine/uridine-preferring nucleoside hydrolase domain-containing protein [Pavlovales sp. CCMP2436]
MRRCLGLGRASVEPGPKTEVVLITDPGPDPDDVKTILILAMLHKAGVVDCRCVIANGGGDPVARATLAQTVLDHLHASTIPVGIGTAGRDYDPMPHEYDIHHYDLQAVRPRLHDGAELLMRTLRDSRPRSLSIVCISSLRDIADAIEADAELVVSRVKLLAIQGGLECVDGRWVADASVNNGFDQEAAQKVYDFCFARGVPMTVTSRNAVPLVPMQLAKSFATRSECAVMNYLADAQFKGLEGLWQRLCEGKLPPRCNKDWYFETFCGVDAEQFAEQRYAELDASVDIQKLLNGFVKPYDVVALMTALPITRSRFSAEAEHTVNGVIHLLLLEKVHTISEEYVVKLLRNTYNDVIIETASPPASPARSSCGAGAGASSESGRGCMRSREGTRDSRDSRGKLRKAAKGPILRSRVTTAWIQDSDPSEMGDEFEQVNEAADELQAHVLSPSVKARSLSSPRRKGGGTVKSRTPEVARQGGDSPSRLRRSTSSSQITSTSRNFVHARISLDRACALVRQRSLADSEASERLDGFRPSRLSVASSSSVGRLWRLSVASSTSGRPSRFPVARASSPCGRKDSLLVTIAELERVLERALSDVRLRTTACPTRWRSWARWRRAR